MNLPPTKPRLKNRIERVERRNQEGEGVYNREDKGEGHYHKRTQVDRYDGHRLSEASAIDGSGTFSGYDDTTNGQYCKTSNKLLQPPSITHDQVNWGTNTFGVDCDAPEATSRLMAAAHVNQQVWSVHTKNSSLLSLINNTLCKLGIM